jgi:uncharacterized cupin superfamily protein
VANLYRPDWDAEQDRPPFRWKRARLGRQAGAEQLGASLFEIPPGGATFPLHAHHANEELLVVLSGRPTLRTSDAERELEEGEVVAFPAGRRGAHRLDNRSEELVRVMIVSTMVAPEVVEYPDSGKVRASSYAPGGVPTEDAIEFIGRREESIDYFAGETEEDRK